MRKRSDSLKRRRQQEFANEISGKGWLAAIGGVVILVGVVLYTMPEMKKTEA